ncbi:MAG: DNA-binding response regulator [uncultured Sulfurovum sp.]|uniref:DNA-binding response regulator n=1 Tax=uncultured Sulfurovum sp. TaxID=269237 RepID=A0A6S6SXW7_9BACT|nr:MAG: DNA-binding response regulator [uncultured Sulfurovum sp.]
MKILVLEDDKLFNDTLEDFLEEEGFEVTTALDPYSALDITYEERFDLYLFDVNLPYETGFSLLKQLRDAGDLTPTMFLTSRNDKVSLTQGFDVGADDYMKKPIDLDELLLRINALLRRQIRSSKLKIGEYVLDRTSKELFLNDEVIKLGAKTIELLLLLLQAKGEVVSLQVIEEALWHTNEEASLGAVRVYVTTLKKYFPNIENIRGVGYRLNNTEV